MKKLLLALLLCATSASAQDFGPNHSAPIGTGPGGVGFRFVGPCTANQALIWSGVNADPICGTPGTPSLPNGQIFVGNAGNVATAVAMSQDCTIVASGVITCTKTNNVPFVASATTDTTNAANISTGVLDARRLTAAPNSGGIPYFSSGTAIGTTATLTQHGMLVGEGAGAAPVAIAAGLNGQVPIGQTGADPVMTTVSQDCVLAANGIITCTKTNNVAFTALATQAIPCTLAQGCTGKTTAATARQSAGLNVWGDSGTAYGDANQVLACTDRMAYTNAALTATRTWTLPAANCSGASFTIQITDLASTASSTNSLIIQRAGADTINGAGTTVTISVNNGSYQCSSDGTSKWSCQSTGPASAGGVTSVTAGQGLSGGTITTSGTITAPVMPPQGRITLQTGTPVMALSQTNKTTLFYDCYLGNTVPYYNGTTDQFDTIAGCEVSDAMVSAASAGQVVASNVYDVWWVHSGANRICLAMSAAGGGGGGWSADAAGSNTARGTGYSQLDTTTRPYVTNKNAIANCFNGATNYGSVSANQATYLGTVYANSNGTVSYTLGGAVAGLVGVYNYYNRVNTSINVLDVGAAYTYTSATIRQARASAVNQIQIVYGTQEDGTVFNYTARVGLLAVAGGFAGWCIGFDATNSCTFQSSIVSSTSGATATLGAGTNSVNSFVGIGFHTISANEFSDGANANNFDVSSVNVLSATIRN